MLNVIACSSASLMYECALLTVCTDVFVNFTECVPSNIFEYKCLTSLFSLFTEKNMLNKIKFYFSSAQESDFFLILRKRSTKSNK